MASEENGMAGLTLKGIVKRYGNANPTLKGIDLDIRDGEFLVLVGPSGCGKSTFCARLQGSNRLQLATYTLATDASTTYTPKTAILPWFSKAMRSIRT